MRAPQTKPLVEEKVFALLEDAAATGRRCPTNPQIAEHVSELGIRVSGSAIPRFLKKLTFDGRIVVRVYAYNWRDVTIGAGPHAGKTTQAPPRGGKPYLILTAKGRTSSRTSSTKERVLPL